MRISDGSSDVCSSDRDAGRGVDAVALHTCSKTKPADEIVPLIQAGQQRFGENRVQEAQGKWPALRDANPAVELHLVGQLQSNKAEDAVLLFDAIHSLDRPSLLTALARAVDKTGRRPPCFIQVNIGAEAQKGGCALAVLAAPLDRKSAVLGKSVSVRVNLGVRGILKNKNKTLI